MSEILARPNYTHMYITDRSSTQRVCIHTTNRSRLRNDCCTSRLEQTKRSSPDRRILFIFQIESLLNETIDRPKQDHLVDERNNRPWRRKIKSIGQNVDNDKPFWSRHYSSGASYRAFIIVPVRVQFFVSRLVRFGKKRKGLRGAKWRMGGRHGGVGKQNKTQEKKRKTGGRKESKEKYERGSEEWH